MNKKNIHPERSSGDRDDFEAINGIGASIAEALYQCGIYRFSELARFTSEELANLLTAKVAFVSIQRIEHDDWLGQARELASRQEKHAPGTNWLELADFFVSFGEIVDINGTSKIHTKVHHSQGDQSECWEGIATEDLVNWMLAHANIPQAPKPADDKSAIKSQTSVREEDLVEEVELDVSDLWVSQVKVPVQGKPNVTQTMVRAEGFLNFSGPDALSLTYEFVPFEIEIYLMNEENHHSSLAATYSFQTEAHKLNYDFKQDFAVPERGKYRMCFKARLLHPFMAEVHVMGPILKVGVG